MPHEHREVIDQRAAGRDALTLRGLDLDEHLRDPSRRQRFVTTMFDMIAPRYDRFTRVFSFAMDAGWKRELLAPLAAYANGEPSVLDLACGTGDLALAAAAIVPGARVLGLDVSARMAVAAEARRRNERQDRVTFMVGDMLGLPVPDASMDVVTVGYGLRNVPDWRRALDEITRVLRPGGRVLTLDFYRPANAVWRFLFLRYLSAAGNLVGWLWHREPVVYGYIAPSVDAFVSWRDFSAALEQRGFTIERARRKLLGGVCIHAARKGA